MKKRSFLRGLMGLTASAPLAAVGKSAGLQLPTANPVRRIHLQKSPIAGFQYYAGEDVWPQLAYRQPVQLIRDLDNRHDRRAVKVLWGNHMLGYLPRKENTAVANLLDRGETLSARIIRLHDVAAPWERVEIAIELVDSGEAPVFQYPMRSGCELRLDGDREKYTV
ncbi:MAG: HIRAN domain-containing protein [Cellvibrionaceae bacterium]